MGGRIAVVGSCNIDLVTYITRMPAPGETLEAPDFATGFGGKGANQAVAAARLGARVAMVGCVGDDIFGPQIAANLRDSGVDTRHLRVVADTPSGVAPIFVEPSGENAILIVKGANGALCPADIDAAGEVLAGCELILMQLEVPLAVIYHTTAWAAARGITTILNPAPARTELDLSRLKGLGFLVPNEGELAALSGLPTRSEAEIADAARALIAGGIGQVIVTLGGRGARLVTADAVTAIPPLPVDPVDTTGAGDAFIGAFAAFLSQGVATEAALRQAAAYAALSITGRGAQSSYATPEEFAAFLAARA